MVERLKVLLISPLYRGGGAERCARELCERLPEVGVDTEMWVARRHPSDPPNVKSIRLRGERWLYPLDWLPAINDWRHLGSRLKLAAIKPGDFDVVHLHNIHSGWVSIRAVRDLCKRMPVVWTLHDQWAVTGGMPYDMTANLPFAEARRLAKLGGLPARFPLHPGQWASRWRRFLEKNIPRPSLLITPSQWLADAARQAPWFQGVPVEIMPYGVSLLHEPASKISQADAAQFWQLPAHRPCVLLVAANLQVPYKGMHLAVQALRLLASLCDNRNQPRPCVLLLGKGSERLAQEISTCLEVRTGYADNSAALAKAYRAAHVCLIPSICDNFPYTVLESFSCERPVIAFRVGGLTEMVGSNERGFSIVPFDTGAMATALAELLRDHKRQVDLGMTCGRWVQQQSDMNTYLRQTRRSYDAIAANQRC